jgi:hypothetical protein
MDVEKEAPIIVKLSQEVPLFGNWTGKIEYTVSIETRLTNLAGTAWQMNNEITNYEFMETGVDEGDDLVEISCNNTYLGSYNQFYSLLGTLSFHFHNAGENTPVYLSQNSAESFALPESGWYLVNSNLQSDFSDGDTSVLPELVASAQKCNAPILQYNDLENDYLYKLNVIDWLYENATLLEE